MFIVRSCGDGKGQIPLGSAVAVRIGSEAGGFSRAGLMSPHMQRTKRLIRDNVTRMQRDWERSVVRLLPCAVSMRSFGQRLCSQRNRDSLLWGASHHWGVNAGGGADDGCSASFRGATLRAFLRGGGETGPDRGGDDLS
jgi:hypothetical protein